MYSKFYGLLIGITTLFASDMDEFMSEDAPFEKTAISMIHPDQFINFIQVLEGGKLYDHVSLHSITTPDIDSISRHQELIMRCVKQMHISFGGDLHILKEDLTRLSELPIVSIHLHGTDARVQDVLIFFPKLKKINLRANRSDDDQPEFPDVVYVDTDSEHDANGDNFKSIQQTL